MAKKKEKKIFISWSGQYGKEIANELKNVLETDVFSRKNICFVSDSDIASGEDWWKKIKTELTSSLMGIVCITRENIKAPWIYFEAGALVGNNVETIPLLFDCQLDMLEKTPLNKTQAILFQEKNKFLKMLNDINDKCNFSESTPEQFKAIAFSAYDKIKNELFRIFERLEQSDFFSETSVYPREVQVMDKKSVFVSAFMSTLNDIEYEKQRKSLLKIVDSLKKIGFTRVNCPAVRIKDKAHFEGREKTVINTFKDLKKTECFVLIYERARASSVLVELGYAIATDKKIVVFYKSKLPFLIQKAGENIPHIHTVKFKDFKVIKQEILSNKMALFGKENEDDE